MSRAKQQRPHLLRDGDLAQPRNPCRRMTAMKCWQSRSRSARGHHVLGLHRRSENKPPLRPYRANSKSRRRVTGEGSLVVASEPEHLFPVRIGTEVRPQGLGSRSIRSRLGSPRVVPISRLRAYAQKSADLEAYCRGEYTVAVRNTRSGGLARILPSASLSSRTLIHSGSAENSFQFLSAASRLS
jgi:hypothetical protein